MDNSEENNQEEVDEVDGIEDIFKSGEIKPVEFVQETNDAIRT